MSAEPAANHSEITLATWRRLAAHPSDTVFQGFDLPLIDGGGMLFFAK